MGPDRVMPFADRGACCAPARAAASSTMPDARKGHLDRRLRRAFIAVPRTLPRFELHWNRASRKRDRQHQPARAPAFATTCEPIPRRRGHALS